MPDISGTGKLLIIAGIFLVVIGGLITIFGKVFPLGRLPGDIFIQKGNFTFYFPLVSGILVSLILTIILNLIFRR
ncbi:MAG: DUF2905 domain-containing protein [Clostridia bacterium]|nr:DUF2905 domain-containing protein [Clostridia bacterium]